MYRKSLILTEDIFAKCIKQFSQRLLQILFNKTLDSVLLARTALKGSIKKEKKVAQTYFEKKLFTNGSCKKKN